MSPRRSRQAGFTLIEVLVALAILSIAIVASIQGFAQGLRLLLLAGNHQRAMLLADQKVREVVDPREGRETGSEGSFRWERTMRTIDAPDLALPGTVQAWRVWEIDARVSWDTQRQVEVRTLRMVSTADPITGAPGTGAAATGTSSSRTGTAGSTSGSGTGSAGGGSGSGTGTVGGGGTQFPFPIGNMPATSGGQVSPFGGLK